MPKYEVEEADQFLKDVEDAAVWILESNFEQSEAMANTKVDEFGAELNALKVRLGDFPESGEEDSVRGLRRFPIIGRFLAARRLATNALALKLKTHTPVGHKESHDPLPGSESRVQT